MATPALVGSVSALMSVLKQHGELAIDPRLLKLAVQTTSRKLAAEDTLLRAALADLRKLGLVDGWRIDPDFLSAITENARR